MTPLNLRSVAQAAGVSPATASLALRSSPSIAAATRARVQAAAGSLGYRPNPLVSQLMGGLHARGRRRRVTMAHIAEHAGVSRATVSLVLRDPKRGSPGIVEKITGAMRALGYARDPLHDALMTLRAANATQDKHTTIALLTLYGNDRGARDFTSHQQMFAGARQRARELGYHMEEFSLDAKGMSARRLGGILLARSIHAIVVAPTTDRSRRLDFDLSPFSCVGLGLSVGWPRIERVSNDHFQSMTLAMQECQQLGYRRIGFIVSRAVSERLGNLWLAAYLLAQTAMPAAQRLAPLMPENAESIAPELPRWLRQQRPDVLIFGNAEIGDKLTHLIDPAIGVANLHVRDAQAATSGIYQASSDVGARAVEAVVSQLRHNIKGPVPFPSSHFIPGRWVPGATAPGPGKTRGAPAQK
ncbi:MAG: LacI family DNA-binding transcriptional regulator [Opitutaceae bacterium]|jgi:LacI family transcriptional regulator|nr:LacI family DNA-binding transcriptional regulator [Opitutaceae bacterium]